MEKDAKPFEITNLDDLKEMFRNYWESPVGWSSSAKNLDDDLTRAGYKIDYKFYHPYVLPALPEKLENITNKMWLYSDWQGILSETAQTLKRPIKVSPELQNDLNRLSEKMIPQIVKLATDIKTKNPALSTIVTPTVMDMVHFIRGAVYGFPPENIQFWVRNYKKRDIVNTPDLKYKPKILADYGVNIGLMRLTDDQGQMLLTQLGLQKNKRAQLQQGSKNIDSLGREDQSGYLRFMEERQYGDD